MRKSKKIAGYYEDRNKLTSLAQQRLCGILAIISVVKGDAWSLSFFADNYNRNFGTYSKKMEVWDAGTDDGYDYMRDMTRGHGMSHGQAMQQAYNDGVVEEKYVVIWKTLSAKQYAILDRQHKKWKSEVKVLTDAGIDDNLNVFVFKKDGVYLTSPLASRALGALEKIGLGVEDKQLVKKPVETPSRPTKTVGPDTKEQQEVLDALLAAVSGSGNEWLIKFVSSIQSQLKRGRTLSEKQLKLIRQNLYKNRMRDKADLFREASVFSLKDQLIKLGSTHPSLRKHIRPLLDNLD